MRIHQLPGFLFRSFVPDKIGYWETIFHYNRVDSPRGVRTAKLLISAHRTPVHRISVRKKTAGSLFPSGRLLFFYIISDLSSSSYTAIRNISISDSPINSAP